MSLPTAHASTGAECERLVNPHLATVKDELSTGILPAPDYRDQVLNCNVQSLGSSDPVNSNWLEAERVAYSAAVARTGARALVAGHDADHAMTITIQVLELDSAGSVSSTRQRDWRMIA